MLIIYFVVLGRMGFALILLSGCDVNVLQGFPVAPLWDYTRSELVGVLSALDFILILSEVCLE